jgi:uncharacterized membrane protein
MQLPEFAKKADVLPIVRAHMDTMRDFREDKVSTKDLLFFFGLPCLIGGILVAIHFGFRTDAVNGFLNTFAILTGLMLNLLVLVFSLSATSAERNDSHIRKEILKQVFTNVCYCITIAITVTGTALISLGYMRSAPSAVTGPVATFILSSFTLNFVLTLLMVMKRMYALISSEFGMANGKKAA